MIHRTVLEWKHIAHGDGPKEIPLEQADRLARLARVSRFAGRSGERVLEHRRDGLRARGFVGILATPGCQLEILPKIEGANSSSDDEATLRHRLVHMLAVAHDLKIETGAISPLAWQRDTLLEILIQLFCEKLADALRKGMPRSYVPQYEERPSLRGRLNTERQFSTLAAAPHRLACDFDELSPDIPLNQVMKAALKRLASVSRRGKNQRRLRELAFTYADIEDVRPSVLRLDLIVLNRSNGRWRDLLNFARLLLGDKLQTTNSGSSDGHALLFEMSALFETYVAKLLKRALSGSGYKVKVQGGYRDCLFEGEVGRFRTKPDLIVERNSKTILIIDTKWKQVAQKVDDKKEGVSQSDVYQLMAYSQLYDCNRVMLLYPHHRDLSENGMRKVYNIANASSERELLIATLDVSRGRRETQDALGELVSAHLTSAAG